MFGSEIIVPNPLNQPRQLKMMRTNITWCNAPREPRLLNDSIHLWLTSIHSMSPYVERLEQILAREEKERASRFVFEPDRNRYIIAHAVLRLILSRYLSIPPTGLEFSHNPHGKPGLRSGRGRTLQFNLSHSNDYVLFGVTRLASVGVDLEYLDLALDVDPLMIQLFDRERVKIFRNMTSDEKRESFFRIWTLSEATVKAQGNGLSVDQMRELTNSVEARDGIHVNGKAGLSTCEFVPVIGYMAAFAVEIKNWKLACWEWAVSDLFAALQQV